MSEVNAELQRAMQPLMQAITDGKIVGVAYVGITTDGQIVNAHAMPGNPGAMYLAIGALQGMISDLIDFIKQIRAQQNQSRIIKPTMVLPNG